MPERARLKTEKLWEQYQYYTRDLTENSRKLAFAVAAICWFFKTPEITFPTAILWSLALLVCFFICDVLQYVSAAFTLRRFLQHEEEKYYSETHELPVEVTKPRKVDYPQTFFLIVKTIFLLASFVALGTEFYWRIFLVARHC
jgi:hypothetical protein